MFALPGDFFFRPQSQDQLETLGESLGRTRFVLAELGIDVGEQRAAAEARFDASVGDGVDGRVILGYTHRIEIGREGHAGGEAQSRGSFGRGCEHDLR